MISSYCNTVFDKCIKDYHVTDNVDVAIDNPYPKDSIEYLLYLKNWIDTVQWHLEDIIRNPNIDPVDALTLKRRIDRSNQERTDVVEFIDDHFLQEYKLTRSKSTATLNTESPAWAIDRLSILALKIYHMHIETDRNDATEEHKSICSKKLTILLEQRKDLSQAIDELLNDIKNGDKYMKVYRQMKMYNDPRLNPILYQQQSK
jgi:hypothetical protein